MLYPKSKEPLLDDELFQNPTCEYRGTPFWSWNCKLNKEELLSQIEALKQMGFGGFHIHPRSGLETVYLGEEYMDLVETCTQKAKKENMLAWLYDEDRWPSGFAGGLVTKTKRFRQKKLIFTPHMPSNLVEKSEGVLSGMPYLLACFDIVLNSKGELSHYERAGENAAANGDRWYAYVETAPDNGRYNCQAYVDVLCPEAIEEFIKVTHEQYKSKVGNYFSSTIPAIFTDEPQFSPKEVLAFAHSKNNVSLPWTTDIPETFFAAYGFDLVQKLPELLWELPDHAVSRARYLYHDHLCDRFVTAFTDKCGEWCKKNNIMLTGHLKFEPTLFTQTVHDGEAMRFYRSFDLPGIDILCDWIELTTAKQTQSAVHQYGAPGMLSELYGVTGWDFDFRNHKFQGDWQAALGVTVRVPHLAWMSMKGSAKRDYPSPISKQASWYTQYPYVEDHYARLNTVLVRGTPVVNVGVIHPIESYWLHWGPQESTGSIRKQLDKNFQDVTNWLLFGLIDFDFISESLLPSQVGEIGKSLTVGKMKYDTIIVPGCETLRRSTFEILKQYHNNGGEIIFMGNCPRYIEAEMTDEVKALYSDSINIGFDRTPLLEKLKNRKMLEIFDSSGEVVNNLLYQLRLDGDTYRLFIARGKRPAVLDNHNDFLDAYRNSFKEVQNLTIKFSGEFSPTLYDTIHGKMRPLSYKIENGKTIINYRLYEHDSLLISLTPTKQMQNTVHEEKYKVLSTFDFREKIEYTLDEPNVCVLDMAEFALDNGEFEPLENVLKADEMLRGRLGFPHASGYDAQPWVIGEKRAEHAVKLRFTFESEATLTECFLGIEEVQSIALNGTNVPVKLDGYYVDKAIHKIPLPPISKGKNELIVQVPFGKRESLENCYLLGDFNVRLGGCKSTLIASSKNIAFSSITSQGLPFYGGNIRYKAEINVNQDCLLKVRVSDYKGAIVRIFLDGNDAGAIAYDPYILEIDGVKKGRHRVEFVLYGNRFNTFGSFHNCNRKNMYFEPIHWYSRGSDWCYEYKLKEMGILSSPVIQVCEKE